MEFPVLFKNVSEEHADYYIQHEGDSKIIGFVNPIKSSDKFGYILAGGKQYGASYNDIVNIAKANGGTNIIAENSSFIGDGGVKYTINIKDGKLTVSQYLKTLVKSGNNNSGTNNVTVEAYCYGNDAPTGSVTTNVYVGETYYCYLQLYPTGNQILTYTIENTTKNLFALVGIAPKNDPRTYEFGGPGEISNGYFYFTDKSKGGENGKANYIEDTSKTGDITVNKSRLTSVEQSYTPGTLNDDIKSKTFQASIADKIFTIYLHEYGLENYTTCFVTLHPEANVTYTINSCQTYCFTTGGIINTILEDGTNKIIITDKINSNINVTGVPHKVKPKCLKFTMSETGYPRFLYPSNWGIPLIKQMNVEDTSWKIPLKRDKNGSYFDCTYSVSSRKGSSYFAHYKYAYYDTELPKGTECNWTIDNWITQLQ